MNSNVVKLIAVVGLTASAFAAYGPFAQAASAAGADNHPDFAWLPTAKPEGTRLFVGNLSLEDAGATTVQYNPKEITIDKPVPWQ